MMHDGFAYVESSILFSTHEKLPICIKMNM